MLGTGDPRAPGSSPRGGAQSLHSTWASATVGTGGLGFRCTWDPGDSSVAKWRVGAPPACCSPGAEPPQALIQPRMSCPLDCTDDLEHVVL